MPATRPNRTTKTMVATHCTAANGAISTASPPQPVDEAGDRRADQDPEHLVPEEEREAQEPWVERGVELRDEQRHERDQEEQQRPVVARCLRAPLHVAWSGHAGACPF